MANMVSFYFIGRSKLEGDFRRGISKDFLVIRLLVKFRRHSIEDKGATRRKVY